MHLGAPVTLSEPHGWISSGRPGRSPPDLEQFWCEEDVASLPNFFLITQLPIPDRYVHEFRASHVVFTISNRTRALAASASALFPKREMTPHTATLASRNIHVGLVCAGITGDVLALALRSKHRKLVAQLSLVVSRMVQQTHTPAMALSRVARASHFCQGQPPEQLVTFKDDQGSPACVVLGFPELALPLRERGGDPNSYANW